jgi:hypothetical protein
LARFRKHKTTLLSFFQIVDGKLINKRADREKIRAEQNASRNSERAKHAAEARWHKSDRDAPGNAPSNARSNAPECPSPSPTLTNVRASVAAVDPSKVIFSEGVALLVRSGASDGSARSFLGSLRKSAGDERLALLVDQAVRDNVCDPRAWLKAAVANPANDPGLTTAISQMAARKAAQATA